MGETEQMAQSSFRYEQDARRDREGMEEQNSRNAQSYIDQLAAEFVREYGSSLSVHSHFTAVGWAISRSCTTAQAERVGQAVKNRIANPEQFEPFVATFRTGAGTSTVSFVNIAQSDREALIQRIYRVSGDSLLAARIVKDLTDGE